LLPPFAALAPGSGGRFGRGDALPLVAGGDLALLTSALAPGSGGRGGSGGSSGALPLVAGADFALLTSALAPGSGRRGGNGGRGGSGGGLPGMCAQTATKEAGLRPVHLPQ